MTNILNLNGFLKISDVDHRRVDMKELWPLLWAPV
jgi:hypothetical protein